VKFSDTNELPLTGLEKWERSLRLDQVVDTEIPITARHWIKLASRNGYIRERSLRSILKPAPNSFLLAIAIRRMNDWVPQVRDTANQVIPRVIELSNPEISVDALSAIFSTWSSWNRIDKFARQLLIGSANSPNLIEPFKSKLMLSSAGPNVLIFTQLGQDSTLDKDLKDIAMNAIQPAVRAKAYSTMFENRFIWSEGLERKWIDKVYGISRMVPKLNSRTLTIRYPFLEILELASLDPSASVRKVAASHLIRNIDIFGNHLSPYASFFSNDGSHAVSYRGKFALEKLNDMSDE